MIAALLRRSLVDLWDNAVFCFGLNIAVLSLAALFLYPISLTYALSPVLFAPAMVVAVWFGLVALAATAELVNQVAARADINVSAMRPDWLFCLVLAFTLVGLGGAAMLLLLGADAGSAQGVARAVGGGWLILVVLELAVLSPAFALDRAAALPRRLAELAGIVLRYPLACFTILALSILAMAATVGLLPGPAGAAYLYLRSGRMMRVGLNAAGNPNPMTEAIHHERQRVANRTPRNLLQPWRTS
ncbi:hypothetical protein JQV27_12800 [Sulfitobacter mediterraneus]|uniref:hypothetical protein n=1 Tax=Sulfitobacter mediterraneus TaxID=83219 RepID=UPI001931F8E0|nr:hypothetical protein [Sulfitobacter mediterraneus]MBM1633973.1 hypothetical protein [Sulfitobacter mediterraneus]MBM1641512.1 hypothetical protein [Sulfitobacter mediterraneus]MBM1645837.1 hypothetical protein [Sulfitobacter mediterraneus]MBM1649631.1 hypothetical protein [Sulfitobacter mediterraneus]MBM1653906.1 hypothetical protein [Sulfitobacter mediterraneus]